MWGTLKIEARSRDCDFQARMKLSGVWGLQFCFGFQPIPRVALRIAPRIGFACRECNSESYSENTLDYSGPFVRGVEGLPVTAREATPTKGFSEAFRDFQRRFQRI